MGNSIDNWIEQWLTDRRQMVVVDGEVSSRKSVFKYWGVTRFFLVYINDLEEGVTRQTIEIFG